MRYAAVWDRCLIYIYTLASALTAVLFPSVNLAATLLVANYVSQHALVTPRSWMLPLEGDSSGGEKA